MKKILFLCMGNICRSPAAHCVFQKLVDDAGLGDQFEIESAGTTGFHVSQPPDRRMQSTLRSRGIPVMGRSRKLISSDLDTYDLILAMDNDNLYDARLLSTDPEKKAKVKLFCEFCRQHSETEVPDPYYGGPHGFEKVMDLIEDGCQGLLEALRETKSA
ncbi:MAG: low molecular weight protein-tyrosine-phosphatase [Verrucomicrobiota bacterium]